MTYLAMDIERVGELTARLRAGANLVDDAQHCLAQAEFLADLPVLCTPALDDIAHDFGRIADQVDWAYGRMTGLKLMIAGAFDWPHMPQPVRTPVPFQAAPITPIASAAPAAALAARWDAAPNNQWNQVHQLSSHNSYEVAGGAQVLFDQGVRSFELDIHRRRPAVGLIGPLLPGLASPWLSAGTGVDDDATPEWHVYHATGASFREYDVLDEGLAAIVALDTSDPLTIFIDLKDGFGGAHTVEAFDRALIDQLGTRIYTPATFRARVSESATLLEVAQEVGWPYVDELQNRIIVVVTDQINGYDRPDAQAFVAPAPQFAGAAPGGLRHVPQPDAVFYNANARRMGVEEIAAVHATDTVLRTYFNPRCVTNYFGEIETTSHYRAVDIALSDPLCGPQTLARPVDVPGPG